MLWIYDDERVFGCRSRARRRYDEQEVVEFELPDFGEVVFAVLLIYINAVGELSQVYRVVVDYLQCIVCLLYTSDAADEQ